MSVQHVEVTTRCGPNAVAQRPCIALHAQAAGLSRLCRLTARSLLPTTDNRPPTNAGRPRPARPPRPPRHPRRRRYPPAPRRPPQARGRRDAAQHVQLKGAPHGHDQVCPEAGGAKGNRGDLRGGDPDGWEDPFLGGPELWRRAPGELGLVLVSALGWSGGSGGTVVRWPGREPSAATTTKRG